MHISAYVWLVLLILFLMAEGATVALVSLWFAAGALAAIIAALLGASVGLQLALFLVVSVALLAMLRPVLKKYVNPKIQRTNVDALAATGRVKMSGMTWSARSIGEENIPAGTVVKIEAVQGVKLLVSPVAVQEAVR